MQFLQLYLHDLRLARALRSPDRMRAMRLRIAPRSRRTARAVRRAAALGGLSLAGLGLVTYLRRPRVVRLVAHPSDVNALLQTIVVQARTITRARYAAVGIGVDPNRPFRPWVFSGLSSEHARAIGHAPRPVGLLGRVARGDKVIRLADAARDPSFRGFPPGHPPMRSFLGVPIRYAGRALGNLYLADKEDGTEFTEDDQRMVEMLAARTGSALETAHLYVSEPLRRQWLRNVVDHMSEAIVILDAEGRVVGRNGAAEAFGIEEGDPLTPLSESPLVELCWPSGETVAWDDLPLTRALARHESVVGVELQLRRPGGGLVPVRISASPVIGETAVPEGAVAVLQDITAIKDVERLRDEWTSVIAHDLRQPINVIVLTADRLLRGHVAGDDARRLLERVRAAADSLTRMASDLLDASRIEARRLTLERRPVDVNHCVKEVVDRCAEITRGHAVRIHAADPPATALVDPVRLEQILTNLLSNAAKHGAAGGVIDVTLRPTDDALQISVTNEGPGLRPDQMDKLFGRFHRLEHGPGGPEGLGLGLYIAKGLVEAHGGKIWVESTPEGPTAFSFTLPIREHP
jgi:PAS domain S-box-containing protein